MKKLLLGAALVAATFTASAQPRPRVSNTEFSAVLVNNMDIAAATEIQQLLFPGADWPATPHIIVAAMRIPAGAAVTFTINYTTVDGTTHSNVQTIPAADGCASVQLTPALDIVPAATSFTATLLLPRSTLEVKAQ
jgi:hypothetical protein